MTLDEIKEAIGIEPYYEEPSGVIYCGDCLDILPKIPEKSIDLVVTDPPYGVRKIEEWDNEEHFRATIDRWLRGCSWSSDRIIWFCAGKMIPYILGSNSNFFRLLIWEKPPGAQYNGASHNNLWYSMEPILLFGDREAWNEKGKDSSMGFAVFKSHTIPMARFGHPTTKPLELMEWLIQHHSNDEDVLLDPFLGSGTTAVAAKQLGRKFIGIEIEPKYCEIAKQRLAQEELFAS